MLKEGSTPVTAYESGAEPVSLGRKAGGDEGENLQWDAVDGNEGVPPLADNSQCGRNIAVELRNLFEGGAIEEVSASFPKTSRARSR